MTEQSPENDAPTIAAGVEVAKGAERGIVTGINGRSGMAEVMWIGGPYPVREDPANLSPLVTYMDATYCPRCGRQGCDVHSQRVIPPGLTDGG